VKLSTKMRYGTRAMLDLALQGDSGPISLKDVAKRQAVSLKYLERLLDSLQAAGLVRAVRGPHGGYQLSKPPKEVNLRQIYEVLEGPEALVDCTIDPRACPRCDICVTQHVWAQMYQACMDILASTSLDDLVQRAREQVQPEAYDI